MRHFRDRRTRPQVSLSTLRAAVTDDDARLASCWRPTFARWDLHPLGFNRWFHAPDTAFPHTPSFAGANKGWYLTESLMKGMRASL